MKKGFINLKILILFLCLCCFYNVRADEFKLSLECNKTEVIVLNSLICDVKVETDVSINNVSFVMEGEGFNLSFQEENGFVNNGNSSGVSLHKDEITSGKIGSLTIEVLGNTAIGKKNINLKKIVATNGSDITINQVSDVVQEITVLSNKSNNNQLKDLLINEKTIESFSATKNEYTITLNVDKVEITAVTDDSKAQVEVINGNSKNLVAGTNGPYEIKVTAEDGSVNVYRVIIKYEIPKSTDNKIKSLELYSDDKKLDFIYDIDKTEFNIDVEANVDKILIKAILNDEKASFVRKYESREVKLNYGKNKVEIRVKAENDSVKTYVLNINREDDRNTNNTLTSLVINGEVIKLSSSIFEYRVDVRYKYNQSDVKATPTSEKAIVEFTNIPLVNGENKPLIITVTAENKEKKEYKIIINRLSEEESKVTLKDIKIEGYDLDFDVNIFEYDLELKNNEKSLNIEVIPTKDLEYVILNNESLGDGSTIIIRVDDDDEGLKTYKINIHVALDKILGMPIDLFCLGFFALGVLSLFGSIVYVVVLNKKYSIQNTKKKIN